MITQKLIKPPTLFSNLFYYKCMSITLEEARKALGKTGRKMTDEEIQKTMATFDYLAEEWLDMYERKIFKGKTIKELCEK